MSQSHKDYHLNKARDLIDQGENHHGEAASHLAAVRKKEPNLRAVEIGRRVNRSKGWVKTFLRRKVQKAEPAPDPKPKRKPKPKKPAAKKTTTPKKAPAKRTAKGAFNSKKPPAKKIASRFPSSARQKGKSKS